MRVRRISMNEKLKVRKSFAHARMNIRKHMPVKLLKSNVFSSLSLPIRIRRLTDLARDTDTEEFFESTFKKKKNILSISITDCFEIIKNKKKKK